LRFSEVRSQVELGVFMVSRKTKAKRKKTTAVVSEGRYLEGLLDADVLKDCDVLKS